MNRTIEFLSRPYADEVMNRFVSYAKIDTQSNRHAEETPTTKGQWDLARTLERELREMGVPHIELDDRCYLIARLPASPGKEQAPCIGLMAHMDTASDVSGSGVRPRIIRDYDGKAVQLSEQYILDPAEFPDLAEHVDDTIIVTDGSTLLGADDKAGVAEIMTAIAWLIKHPELEHGPIDIYLTPDEETGKGMDHFPLQKARAVACYTLDGGKAPEIEAECFNAYAVKAEFFGKVIHIGAARGKLANAVAMAASFIGMLPRSESPEATDSWYGYYCPIEVSGTIDHAWTEVYLRDFSSDRMQERIAALKAFAAAVEVQFPGGQVKLAITQQYLNMKQKLDAQPAVLEKLERAIKTAGFEPIMKPIRGGTDGSRLTEMGIPTPNLFTGGYNYHSRFEWASVSEMALAVETIINLVLIWAE
ncbi:MAG: peptidase T [Rectinema subterraneum]|uniref:peptidase T n=1 Tax=Rectinema subterraneum TaxID=2653714 RepID=UPI003C79BA72